MVLFKRKTVQYLPPPIIENDDTEIWQIKQTQEIFIDYESYLARMDFYKQRRFVCEISGHSGLSFFEALKSELTGAQELEESFPEALKGPILRRVQFQTIPRIDTLVDLIYEEFRADYYPGEAVIVNVGTGDRLTGIVRDKTSFGAKILPDGTLKPPFSRYFVSLDNRPLEEAVVDDTHIYRDRKTFTKQVLRSFIKKTVTRELWTGAPWQVKSDVAKKYHIDVRIPQHLLYETKTAKRKMKSNSVRDTNDADTKPETLHGDYSSLSRLSELKPAVEIKKNKHNPAVHLGKRKYSLEFNSSPQSTQSSLYMSNNFQASGSHSQVELQQAHFHKPSLKVFSPSLIPQPPAPLPQIKYPIEDLLLPPRSDGLKRPVLKFLTHVLPSSQVKLRSEENEILMESVGLLLESWDILNVFCEVFLIDSFTFDDFSEAMQISSEELQCELFVEIHCAVLKMLVASEADGGKILVSLPEMEEDIDMDEDSEPRATHIPTPQPEIRSVRRTTRSSLATAELTAQPKLSHRASEMQAEVNWVDRLKKRDFKNGGWQSVIVGLLYQLSKSPRYFKICEPLLKELAPLDADPTPITARKKYSKLDINQRIQILDILCMLIVETKAIRTYMEECNEQMTGFRKEKIRWQRDRKQYVEELRQLNEERKILQKIIMPSSPVPENKRLLKKIVADEENHESIEDGVTETSDENLHTRSLRRGHDRAIERKRKRKAQVKKKEKTDVHSICRKSSRKLTKLIKDIQRKQDLVNKCEKEILTLENDLREADCPRTRFLGKDKFCNRYFWFERNGMPYGGLPNSSTAAADYSNGRIWIQGPDDAEREGFIEMKAELQNEYKNRFKMTVPERKRMEEGLTSVYNAHQWGYYEDPEDVDALISWLDPRGYNEMKLLKELKMFRDKIISNMQKRKSYLHPMEENVESSSRRIMTRRMEAPPKNSTHRCLTWRNNMALSEIGHLHSEQPRLRKPTKKAAIFSSTYESERPFIKPETKGRNKRNFSAR